MTARWLAIGGAALALAVGAAAPGAAQNRVYVQPEAGTPVVAVEVLVSAGAADADEGAAGIAYLTARGVTAPLAPMLDSLGAHLAVDAHRDAVSFTVIAAPDAWREATRMLLVALFRDPLDGAAVERQRTEIAAEIAAREQSPADELVRHVDAALFGEAHPWARPAVGTAESIARISVPQVDSFLRRHFTADRTVIAVVGPVDPDAAAAHLDLFMEPGALRRTAVDRPSPAGETVRVQSNTITAWVSTAYPFPGGADAEALRMLAEMAIERVSFGPARRAVYDARAEVVRHGAGGEIRLHLVVPPRDADRWAEQLRGAMRDAAMRPFTADEFEERRRRFRGGRLIALAAPEARARALARAALLGRDDDAVREIESLTPTRLYRAARELSDPVVVILGPFEDGEE